MFKNITRCILGGSVRSNPNGFKTLNNSVRSFNKSTINNTSLSPIAKTLLSGSLLVGTGYVLNNTLNKPTEKVNSDTKEMIQSSNENKMHPIVKKYMKGVYEYTTFNVATVVATSIIALKSGYAHKIINMSPYKYLSLFGIGGIGTLVATLSFDNNKHSTMKHASLVAFNVLSGLSLCCVGLIYRPEIIMKAALYTAGLFGTLSYVAINSEQNKYLWLGGPLMAGLTLVCLTSFAPLVLPSNMITTLKIADSITLYFGLMLFSMFILYDTQKIMNDGEKYRSMEELRMQNDSNQVVKPDYIKGSLGLYLDIINMFIRILDLIDIKK